MPKPASSDSTRTPRWVKVFGLGLAALTFFFIVVTILSGGNHGPARHLPSTAPGGHTPPGQHGGQQP